MQCIIGDANEQIVSYKLTNKIMVYILHGNPVLTIMIKQIVKMSLAVDNSLHIAMT